VSLKRLNQYERPVGVKQRHHVLNTVNSIFITFITKCHQKTTTQIFRY